VHTDPPEQANDADFNINLPTMDDEPSRLGTVRSSSRAGRLPVDTDQAVVHTDHLFARGEGNRPRTQVNTSARSNSIRTVLR